MDVLANDIKNAWSGFIGLTEKLVIPDWGALVALIPVGLALVVVLFFGWQLRLWATAGPTRRGIQPRPPRPPAGIHMAGPSLAPLFAAAGSFLLFLGIILGGLALWLGLAAIVVTLLYWLREAVRDYATHVEPTRVPALAAGGAMTPPPGVHLPAPSFRPILIAVASCVLLFGLVAGPAVLVAGVIVLVIALVGWLRDARLEYHAVETADRTGHLEAGAAPRFPTGTLVAGTVIVAFAVLVNAGLFSGAGGGTATPSAAGASPAGGGGGGSPAPSQVKADVTITAQGIAFVTKDVQARAAAPFTIAFDNQDNGIPHNVEIKDASGTSKFKGDIVTGVKTTLYSVPALAAGTYSFICDVHPNMTGTLTVK